MWEGFREHFFFLFQFVISLCMATEWFDYKKKEEGEKQYKINKYNLNIFSDNKKRERDFGKNFFLFTVCFCISYVQFVNYPPWI